MEEVKKCRYVSVPKSYFPCSSHDLPWSSGQCYKISKLELYRMFCTLKNEGVEPRQSLGINIVNTWNWIFDRYAGPIRIGILFESGFTLLSSLWPTEGVRTFMEVCSIAYVHNGAYLPSPRVRIMYAWSCTPILLGAYVLHGWSLFQTFCRVSRRFLQIPNALSRFLNFLTNLLKNRDFSIFLETVENILNSFQTFSWFFSRSDVFPNILTRFGHNRRFELPGIHEFPEKEHLIFLF